MKQFIRTILKYLFDIIVINLSSALTIVLVHNFDFSKFLEYVDVFAWGILIIDLTFIFVMSLMRGYRVLWRFAGSMDRIKFTCNILFFHVIYSVLHLLLTDGYPISFYIISAFLSMGGLTTLRLAYKIIYRLMSRTPGERIHVNHNVKVMIVGAGDAGIMLLNDLRRS